ncbi:MAG TPA: SDR family NAD(P)-dependent oxidoreductase [Acidimicrobiia bacterium]|nr:SDR family NAD(P)-dependent oxidoreductase [Acidimicrobiia bacterium]
MSSGFIAGGGGEGIADVSDRSLAELQSLEGRVAVVTGGARGIGFAIVRRLAEAGAAVAIADRDLAGAKASAAAVAQEFGRPSLGVELDVTDAEQTAQVAEAAAATLGGLDIWVSNAGIYPASMLVDLTEEEWDLVLDVNLKGVFLGSQAAARKMLDLATPGVLVNIASISGIRSSRGGRGHYSASKHGVIGLTKSFAVELGPKGIRSVGVAPGTILTEGIEEQAGTDPARTKAIWDMGRGFPLGRLGVGDDIARVVTFLASDMAIFMTGTTVVVDAGSDAVM